MPYRLSQRAERDLAEIFHYTFVNFGPQQAERYLAELGAIFDLIASQPKIGRLHHATTRYFVHGSHIIFYRDAVTGVVIGRISHASRNRT